MEFNGHIDIELFYEILFMSDFYNLVELYFAIIKLQFHNFHTDILNSLWFYNFHTDVNTKQL